MLMLCLSWGFNQIAVKLVLPDMPPMLQALIRSAGALPVLLIIGWLRGVKFFERDGTLWPGVFAGVLFGIEFVLIYRGLLLTSASRAVVFLYTAPFFVALGSYLFLGERLRASQWGGLALSFCRRRAGDRRAPGQCRCQGAARRPLIVAAARCGRRRR
jgi:drug/metabolite transporter (DMT)-like permease